MISKRDKVVTSIVVLKTALINKNNQILLIKRSAIDHSDPEKWEFPGGKLEKGELIEEVFSRELYEEVGVNLTEAKIGLAHVSSQLAQAPGYEDITIVTITQINKTNDIPIITLSEEHIEYKWLNKTEALKLNLREGTRKALNESNFI